MVIYNRPLNDEENLIVNQISQNCGILRDTARLLLARGVDSVKKAQKFLSPSSSNFYNPFLLSDMKEGVERIKHALKNNQNILIFGDYDVDGICATTILYFCLKELGVTPRYMIPEREVGYGLSIDRIIKANEQEKIDLLITVDCGVSEKDNVEILKNLGVDVIVTDHHQIPEVLPDCLVINPQKEGQEYPFKSLCGAGVAYKVAYALMGKSANQYLDLVALATVADSMELVDENRDLVTEGLKIFNSSKIRLPFKFMISDNKSVTSQTLAFNLGPKLNACGRMGDALLGLKLLVESDENKIFDMSVKLNEYNAMRQAKCEVIYNEAKAIIAKEKLYNDRVILLYDKNWQSGFIGIVAVRLADDYRRPVIMFSQGNGCLKGSARSVDDINIYKAIASGSDLLTAFGGHSQAAGVSVVEENFDAFRARVCKYVLDNYGEVNIEKDTYAEWEIVDRVSTDFAKEINLLEPFGLGNKKPYFALSIEQVSPLPMKLGSPHYTIKTDKLELLNFNGVNDVFKLVLPTKKTVIIEMLYSVYKGRESVKGSIKNIISDYEHFYDADLYAFKNQLENLKVYTKNAVVEEEKIPLEKGYTTLYVLSDPKNLPKELNGLKVYYYDLPFKNASNCIVVSPVRIFEGYEKVVYLDKPLCYFDDTRSFNGQNYHDENRFLKMLDTQRESIIYVYNTLISACGSPFINSVEFCRGLHLDCFAKLVQFVFAIEVFLELGFFDVSNGILTKIDGVKNPLENSKIFSAIRKEKEQC